jgi:hypothetical protein
MSLPKVVSIARNRQRGGLVDVSLDDEAVIVAFRPELAGVATNEIFVHVPGERGDDLETIRQARKVLHEELKRAAEATALWTSPAGPD